jgi:hypothetical protein
VLVFVAYRTPFLIDNLVAGGFARLDKTYGPTSGTDRIDGAAGVAVDGAGNISVVTGPGRVFRFAPDGASLPGWSLDGNNLSVHTIKADSSGNLYILSDGAIHKQDSATGFDIKTIAVDDVFGFYDLALAPDGSLLSYLGGTADRLVRFDPGGAEVARYPNPISEITGAASPPPWQVRLTIAPDGTIYLLSQDPAASSPILAYTPGGKYRARFGAYGDAQDQLQHPQAIFHRQPKPHLHRRHRRRKDLRPLGQVRGHSPHALRWPHQWHDF